MFKIVGVTFNNSDGESRQEILKNLYKITKYCGRIVGVTLKHVSFKGEPAIQIIDDELKKCIGWIPKDEVERFSKSKKAVVEISKFSDSYYVKLRKMEVPDKDLYLAAKINAKRNNKKIPVYDAVAYNNMLKRMKVKIEKQSA